MLASDGQTISILEEILGEKEPARKWFDEYLFDYNNVDKERLTKIKNNLFKLYI